MLVAPLISNGFYANLVWVTGFNLVILSTIWTLSYDKRAIGIGILCSVPYVMLNCLAIVYSSIPLMALSKVFLCIFILYSIFFIALKVLKEPIIDTNLIFGSIMIYLLAAIFWARLYWLADIFYPEATFKGLIPMGLSSISLNNAIENQFNLMYYSITTLTTLGLGDIYATKHIGKALTITEAVFGQLFLATMIAKLVSIWPNKDGDAKNAKPIASSQIRRHGSFIAVFVMVLMIVLIAPVFVEGYYANLFLQACFNLLLLFTVYTLGDRALQLGIGVVIAIPFLAFDWLSIFTGSLFYMAISFGFLSIFLIYAIYYIAKKVLQEPVVDTNLIFGAIMIYLLGGILWSKMYWLTAIIAPGSFTGIAQIDLYGNNISAALQNQFDFFYYSFTTAASLGLGDIAPVNHAAKSLTALEAVFGQLFVATTIAKMVTVWRVR